MARTCAKLTDQKLIQAAPADKPRRLYDGGGLYVEISPTGSKIWRMKFQDANKKESRLTFGPYPEVSIEAARTRRSAARELLKQGLDPRRDFNDARIRSQTRIGERRLLPLSIDKTKVTRGAAQVGWEAAEQIQTLVFPTIQRLHAAGVSQADISARLAQLRRERSVEVENLLYDICVEIAWSCLDLGIEKDELVEAMADSRVAQRRWH